MLLLSNDDIEAVLDVKSCIEVMEDAYRELGEHRGASGVRSEILTPTTRDDGLYSFELPDLADLVLKRTPGRRSGKDVTLFLNYMGLGYQFAATGHVIWRRAQERGIGRQLDTSWFTSEVPS
jgi:ornithine cyclodeaminase/alanine dehydrogenase-like protein (mu-crystallin family)